MDKAENGTVEHLAKSEIIWARIKPVNKQKGQRRRRHRVFSMQFDESRGWYKVPRFIVAMVGGAEQEVDMKKYLSGVRNDQENEESALVFDVCTAAEAKAIENRERQTIEAKRKTENPVDLTSQEARAADTKPARRGPGRPRERSVAAGE